MVLLGTGASSPPFSKTNWNGEPYLSPWKSIWKRTGLSSSWNSSGTEGLNICWRIRTIPPPSPYFEPFFLQTRAPRLYYYTGTGQKISLPDFWLQNSNWQQNRGPAGAFARYPVCNTIATPPPISVTFAYKFKERWFQFSRWKGIGFSPSFSKLEIQKEPYPRHWEE